MVAYILTPSSGDGDWNISASSRIEWYTYSKFQANQGYVVEILSKTNKINKVKINKIDISCLQQESLDLKKKNSGSTNSHLSFQE